MRILLSLGLIALSAPVQAAMPPSGQNALVKRYWAVCHTDAARNGVYPSNTTMPRSATPLWRQ
jgi:hypothetical protein